VEDTEYIDLDKTADLLQVTDKLSYIKLYAVNTSSMVGIKLI